MSEEKTLREALEKQALLWHHVAQGNADDDGEDDAGRAVYDECAGDLARVLADYPHEAGPTKVLVVVEKRGDTSGERRYDANQADASEYGHLRLLRKGREVATYQPNAWLSVREDGSSTGDPYFIQGKKLAIALDALREINADAESVAGQRALAALEDIADVDL